MSISPTAETLWFLVKYSIFAICLQRWCEHRNYVWWCFREERWAVNNYLGFVLECGNICYLKGLLAYIFGSNNSKFLLAFCMVKMKCKTLPGNDFVLWNREICCWCRHLVSILTDLQVPRVTNINFLSTILTSIIKKVMTSNKMKPI